MRIRPQPTSAETDSSPEETLRRIERYIQNPPENSRIFTIGPAIAEQLLEKYNVGNRSKKPGKIEEYCRDMMAGEWIVTGDTLKFSDAKLLRDGQNRLAACVRAGKSFQTHVIFGVPDTAFSKMDQGRNRSGGDVLTIAGYSDTNNLAAAARWLWLFDNNRVKSRESLIPDQVLHLLRERYSDLPPYVKQAGRIYQTTGQPKGLVAAILYMITKKNPTKAAEWAAAWENGQDGGRFKPMSLATKKIQEIKTLSSGRVHDVVRAALLVKAWNLFVEGKRGAMADMDWTPAAEFPPIKG